MKLSDLSALIGATKDELFVGDDPKFCAVNADSRSVAEGELFVCMPSVSRDTHEFLPGVAKAGAKGAIVQNTSGLMYAKSLGLPALVVEPVGSRFNFALGKICRAVFDDPTSKMRVFGVTGTNGKTTVSWMVHHALESMGRQSAYVGTLGFKVGGELTVQNNTTPFPVELWRILHQAAESGVSDVIMEVSSHALFERRLSAVQFDVGVFTNLSQDHLDFHGTMEHYAAAKKLLFTEYAAATTKPFVGALNVEDERGKMWSRELPCRVMTFGATQADLTFVATSVTVNRIEFTALLGGEEVSGKLKFGGTYNVENASSALAGLVSLGHGFEESVRALETVDPVPGRFEAVSSETGVDVIVDYAHTPDALTQLLKASRLVTQGKIITVFGCGGDRDRSKRPQMAAAASELSDLVVVTSDNPRTEDPEAILADVRTGLVDGVESVEVLDRREAIFEAVKRADVGDLVVIAGKGHEDYQIIGRTKVPMDDRVMAREALAAR